LTGEEIEMARVLEKLANVHYGEKYKEYGDNNVPLHVSSLLHETVWELATLNPHWAFFIFKGRGRAGHAPETPGQVLQVDAFEVRMDGQGIGSLWSVYYRNQHCVGVSNQRIGNTLERSNMKRTTDKAKAVQLAKKYFGKKTAKELLDDLKQHASNTLSNSAGRHMRDLRDLNAVFHDKLTAFIREEVRDQFREYLGTCNDGRKMIQAFDDSFAAKAKLKAADAVYEAYRSDDTCLVVLDNGKYIVQNQKQNYAMYDDSDLPDYVRSKIGLLKLVNPGQIVGDTGCRVKENMFVIVVEGTTC
jgi:hypothetical protein